MSNKEDRVYELLTELQDIFTEEMASIEFIKVSQPLFIGDKKIAFIGGIEIKNVISEQDAEVWS